MPFSMKFVRRRKVAAVSLRRHYRSRKQSTLIRSASPPLTKFMKYAVPAVLALLPLQYQQSKPHPAPLWCFVAATTAYWLIVGATKLTKCFHVLWRAALASGVLSLLSMLSMFLPYPVSLLPLLIWLLLALILTTYTSSPIIAKIKAFAIWAGRLNSENHSPTLPV